MSEQKQWPKLAEDLAVLEEVLETKRHQLSAEANRYKRRFNTSQWWVVLGGIVLIALSATEAALRGDPKTLEAMQRVLGENLVALTIVKAIWGFVLGVIVLLGQEMGWQREWLDRRVASEEMKHEYYYFLGRVGEYGAAEDPVRLLKRRVQNVEEELQKKIMKRWGGQ